MARLRTGRRWLAVLGAAGLALAAPQPVQAAAPKSAPAPARGLAWKATKLYGVDYVSLRDVAERFGMATQWVKAREQLKLHSQWTEMVFELDKRELRWNGHRVFLAEPVITHRRTLWLAENDIRATLVPLLQPAGAPAPGARPDDGRAGRLPRGQVREPDPVP